MKTLKALRIAVLLPILSGALAAPEAQTTPRSTVQPSARPEIEVWVKRHDGSNVRVARSQSLPDAQAAVRKALAGGVQGRIEVLLHGGTHRIESPLVFAAADSGSAEQPVTWRAAEDAHPVVSGGRAITNWRNMGENHWVAVLPDVKAGKWYFRQLWAGDKRLQRACLPNQGFLQTAGPLTPYKAAVNSGINPNGTVRPFNKDMKTALLARCGFKFKDGDIQEWDNWQEAEIITYHKWECSWQTIRRIDAENNLVYMNSPCRYPVGRFGSMRYRVENIPSALDEPGEWYLDGRKGELHYLGREGENPDTMDFTAPFAAQLLLFTEAEDGKQGASHIKFEDIAFKHCRYELGIYDIAPNWPEEIRKLDPSFPEDPRPGYTDSQAAPRSGEAVRLTGAQDIAFERCRFNHLGAWALHIDWRSSRIAIKGCEIFDAGGGAVQIGNPVRLVEKAGIPEDWAPSHNTIDNCWIHHCGLVHPSAVGVMIAQAHDNTISHCEIHDLSYSGISSGWTWGKDKCYTYMNRISNNYIHHVARKLGDAAGLYSLGNNFGSVCAENYLDQIVKAPGVHGVVDAMGFDEHSNDFLIDRNVVGRISGKPVSFNRNSWDDMRWTNNNFPVGKGKEIMTWEGNTFPEDNFKSKMPVDSKGSKYKTAQPIVGVVDFDDIKRRSGLEDEAFKITTEWVLASEKRSPEEKKEWAYPSVDAPGKQDRPRVLLVGDSITFQYYNLVKQSLSGKAYVSKLATSRAIDQQEFLPLLKQALSQGKIDVVHFNNSLHCACSPMVYRRCYDEALKMIEAMQPQAKIVVALSTPLRPGSPQEHLTPVMREYNEIAKDLAHKHGAEINDLFKPMLGKPEYYADPYHYKPAAKQIQAELVVETITPMLENAVSRVPVK